MKYCLFGNWQQQGIEKLPRESGAEISCKALALWDVVDAVIPVRCIVSQPVISFYAKLKAHCAASSCNLGCEIGIPCTWPQGVKWLLSFSLRNVDPPIWYDTDVKLFEIQRV